MGSTRIHIIVALVLLLIGFSTSNLFADPILGQEIFYTGGPIQVTVLPNQAIFQNQLYLFAPGIPQVINGNPYYLFWAQHPTFIANAYDVGNVVTLSNLPFAIGDELVFAIYVHPTDDVFLTGPGTRNYDGMPHAKVDFTSGPSGNSLTLKFEDLFHATDGNYDDANFLLSGGVSISSPATIAAIIFATPEPAPITLVLLGGCAAIIFRRKLRV
jgi:hypothetical protein